MNNSKNLIKVTGILSIALSVVSLIVGFFLIEQITNFLTQDLSVFFPDADVAEINEIKDVVVTFMSGTFKSANITQGVAGAAFGVAYLYIAKGSEEEMVKRKLAYFILGGVNFFVGMNLIVLILFIISAVALEKTDKELSEKAAKAKASLEEEKSGE